MKSDFHNWNGDGTYKFRKFAIKLMLFVGENREQSREYIGNGKIVHKIFTANSQDRELEVRER